MTSNNNDSSKSSSKTNKPESNDEILLGFQKLRDERRFISNKLNELELDLQEHRMVIDTLKDLDGDRKCFRMTGGILCERTVKDVLPILKSNEENLVKVLESLVKELAAKGREISNFQKEHRVKFRHIDELINESEMENQSQNEAETDKKTESNTKGRGGGSVLV